ncbi:MAG: hypothetical protein MJE66_12955 [Proteobacteria bacterium]|nr:hypothetical protein [Pseudomonadota bacterium]
MMRFVALALGAALVALFAAACAHSPAPDPMRYRLAHSGTHWDRVGDDPVLQDLQPRYPAFFALILDPERTEEPDLRPLRRDLEARPVDRRNYDALNAVAIAYFEINYRAEASREAAGMGFLGQSFRSAKLLAVPWRAYMEIEDPNLRSAVLAFFEDAASGEKLGSERTAPRLLRVVGSLESREADPARKARIRRLVAELLAQSAAAEASALP